MFSGREEVAGLVERVAHVDAGLAQRVADGAGAGALQISTIILAAGC